MSTWTRSSFCGSGACLEAMRTGPVILVQDSKHPASSGGTLQVWSRDEWEELLGALLAGVPHPGVEPIGGGVRLGLKFPADRHEPLVFDRLEWGAFCNGVIAGEFDVDKLSSPAPALSGGTPEGGTTGPVPVKPSDIKGKDGHDPSTCSGEPYLPGGAQSAATGAGDDAVPPAPVAAHYQTAGWGGVPGECGVECVCGWTLDGFDSIAEAAALLDEHIAAANPATSVPVAAHTCTCPPLAPNQGVVDVNRGHLLGCPALTPKPDYREHEPCQVETVYPMDGRRPYDVCRTHTYFGNGIEPNSLPWNGGTECHFETRFPVGYQPAPVAAQWPLSIEPERSGGVVNVLGNRWVTPADERTVAAQPHYVLDRDAILELVQRYGEACQDSATEMTIDERDDACERAGDLLDAIRAALTPVPAVEPEPAWGSGPLVEHNPETPADSRPRGAADGPSVADDGEADPGPRTPGTGSADPYTTSARLCDDSGMVSDARVAPDSPGTIFDPDLTYSRLLNNLRGHTGLPPYTGPAFQCTGSAHLAGEHIRCNNPIHDRGGAS